MTSVQLEVVQEVEDARALFTGASGSLLEKGPLRIVLNRHLDWGVMNYAYARNVPSGQAEAILTEAAEIFAEQNRMNYWVLSPATQPEVRDALTARGLYKRGENPVMVGLRRPDPIEINPAIRIVELDDSAQILDSLKVIAAGFGFDKDPKTVKAFDDMFEETWPHGGVRYYLAYVGNEVAGAGQLSINNGWAGCYSAAVLPAYRRLGVETALLHRRFQDGFDAGARGGYIFTYSSESPVIKACAKIGYPVAFSFENWR